MMLFSWWPRKSRKDAAQKKVDDFKKDLFKVADESSKNTQKANQQLEKRQEDIALYLYLATREGKQHE